MEIWKLNQSVTHLCKLLKLCNIRSSLGNAGYTLTIKYRIVSFEL